ncbi:sensor histidine kinase [Vulgatibacter sp.]|uniref:sensor histidine kinase n=1 Tax=Vulgatibacter sp. TaxID=1971226 RepID=UPI003561838A
MANRLGNVAMRKAAPSPLAVAAVAAARPLAGLTQAATLAWDEEWVVRGAAGACPAVFGKTANELRGRPLGEFFERPESLADAIHFGTARPVKLHGGILVRLEAGPCPGGAVGIIRRQTGDELDLTRLVSALGHEMRNAFASVLLAVQSLTRNGEVASERGRRRLVVAERELRRIECVLRGLQEVGRAPVGRPIDASPERLVADAFTSLGPEPGGPRVELVAPEAEGEPAFLDPARVRLALEEMIRHGIRAVASGGRVEVSVERRPGELALVVTATGPDAVQPSSGVEVEGGKTLGLAVAEGVARAHGGHLESEGVEGGCRLTLVLPQRAARN